MQYYMHSKISCYYIILNSKMIFPYSKSTNISILCKICYVKKKTPLFKKTHVNKTHSRNTTKVRQKLKLK